MTEIPPINVEKSYVISPDIIKDMANECGRNKIEREKIYKLLLNNVQAREDKFRIEILAAWSALAWSKLTGRKKLNRESALDELKKIKKAAAALDNYLPKLDFSRMPEAGTVEEYLYHYLGRNSDNYQEEINRWRSFQDDLKKQIEDYAGLELLINKNKKSGRHAYLGGLAEFIYQIALLYEQTTGKKFRVDKPVLLKDGKRDYVTDGMRFAHVALGAIHRFSSKNSDKYTQENFQSSCDIVSKRLNKSRKSEKPPEK